MSVPTDIYMVEDISSELENPRLWEVLAPAVYNPTPTRLDQIRARYRMEPTWRLLGCRSGATIIGCIGLELGANDAATIRHIAVIPERRGEGIGRALIQQALRTFMLTQISAETDHNAVEFYRACGFAVQSLGEKYPGTIRFLCTYGVGREEAERSEDAL
jgi:ribosomal protein S18 acetylase RimI-like enzyme